MGSLASSQVGCCKLTLCTPWNSPHAKAKRMEARQAAVHQALRADNEAWLLGQILYYGRRATSSRFESTLLVSWDAADDERTLIWRGVS